MHNVMITLGRWGGGFPNITIPDLNESTLRRVAVDHCRSLINVGDVRSMATQVLIWEDVNRVHNLIAIYDISVGIENGRLVTL